MLKGIEVPPPPALSMTSPRTQALLILDHLALQALLGAQDGPKPDSGTGSGKTATVVLSVRRKPRQPISAEQLLALHKTRPNAKPSVSISTTMH